MIMDNKIILENEEKANKIISKFMRFTFTFYTLIFLSDMIGIFTVDKKLMIVTYILSIILLLSPTLFVDILKKKESWVKYYIVASAILYVFMLSCTLAYHSVIMYIYAIGIASMYFNKKVNIVTIILSIIFTAIGQLTCFSFNILNDHNLYTMKRLILFGIIPRMLTLILISILFVMLCDRTSELLSNLMSAAEQKKMLDNMTRMKDKSSQVSLELVSLVNELSKVSETTLNSNNRIAKETESIVGSYSENSNSMQMVENNTQNIVATIEGLNRGNKDIINLSEQVQNDVNENQCQMELVTKSMKQINESTNNCRDVIMMLEDKSKEIINIVNVITDISNQTNILSLNASIEAARAGEHGRGFAVVAGEIQKLAEQTRNAVNDIGCIIQEVVDNTDNAATVMGESAKITSVGMNNVKKAKELSNTIKDSNINMVNQFIKMGKTTEQVANNSKQIENEISKINVNIQKNLSSLEEVLLATKESSDSEKNLVEMVDKIKELSQQLNDVVR